jgi:redox-sensitive bicupin YhaK (pirin superfamily)
MQTHQSLKPRLHDLDGGIVHSERTPGDLRDRLRVSHGLQLWMALPAGQEECEPGFHHFSAEAIPKLERDGAHIAVLAGTAFGATSPAPARSPTVYLDVSLKAGASLSIPADYSERALYALDGACSLDGVAFDAHQMLVLPTGATPVLQARDDWMAQRFTGIAGESGFIPFPADRA